jgi:hypothetical protein
MKVTINGSVLKIEIDMQKPTPSASGKTLVVASTGGFMKTQAQVDGKEVSVSVNATVKP